MTRTLMGNLIITVLAAGAIAAIFLGTLNPRNEYADPHWRDRCVDIRRDWKTPSKYAMTMETQWYDWCARWKS